MNIAYAGNEKSQQTNQTNNKFPVSGNICFADNPVGFILTEAKSPQARRILNTIIGLDNHFDLLHPTRETIADKSDCCTKTVTRWSDRWANLGMITKVNNSDHRTKNYTSNIYTIHKLFHNETIRSQLKEILYNLRYFCVRLLRVSKEAMNRTIEKSVPLYSLKDKRDLINLNNNSVNTSARDSRIVNHGGHTKDLYPHLCESARYLAVQMRLSPSSSAYLALVPEHIMLEVLKGYCLAVRKQTPRDTAKFVGSILRNKIEQYATTIDYAFVNAIITKHNLDRSWKALSFVEHSQFVQQISHIGKHIELVLKKDLQVDPQNETTKQLSLEARMKRESDERIKRARSNPYSCYYTGPIQYNVVRKPAKPKPLSLEAPSLISPLPSSAAPSPDWQAALNLKPGNINSAALLMEQYQTSIKTPGKQPHYDNERAVDDYKNYITIKLPPFIESLKKANIYSESLVNGQLKRYTNDLTKRDRETLKSEGFTFEI